MCFVEPARRLQFTGSNQRCRDQCNCVKISGKTFSVQHLLIHLQVCVPIYAWWLSSTQVSIACTDGSVRGFQYDLVNKGWKRRQTSRCNGNLFLNIETIAASYFLLIPGVPEGLKSVKSITKLQFIPTFSLVYVGRCSSLPTESNDSNVLSKFTILAKEYLPLVPFGDRIADILYLQPCKGIDVIVLV